MHQIMENRRKNRLEAWNRRKARKTLGGGRRKPPAGKGEKAVMFYKRFNISVI